jgi:hypothetical protein
LIANIPETNARGWPLWVLLDQTTKEIMRHEYKSHDEAEKDNSNLAKGANGWIWTLNDPSMTE